MLFKSNLNNVTKARDLTITGDYIRHSIYDRFKIEYKKAFSHPY